jgi:hypothetical protein
MLGSRRAFARLHPDQSGTRRPLDGFIFWTSDGLYEVREKHSPEAIFYQLLNAGLQKLAEPLGKTVGLDLLTLYESAGDKYFAEQSYGRALE